jgi:hypothetical protein
MLIEQRQMGKNLTTHIALKTDVGNLVLKEKFILSLVRRVWLGDPDTYRTYGFINHDLSILASELHWIH